MGVDTGCNLLQLAHSEAQNAHRRYGAYLLRDAGVDLSLFRARDHDILRDISEWAIFSGACGASSAMGHSQLVQSRNRWFGQLAVLPGCIHSQLLTGRKVSGDKRRALT